MKYIKRINIFYVFLSIVLVFFLQRQFFSLLDVEIFRGIELNANILVHTIVMIVSLVIVIICVYLIPLLLIIHISKFNFISLPNIKVNEIVIAFVSKQRELIVKRNILYCRYRC